MSRKEKKPVLRSGCLYGFIILFLIWLGGCWYLWQATVNAPVNTGKSARFEIIPGSDQHTSPDDAETDDE